MEGMKKPLRFPVVAHGAEFLVMGYLMRRNILTYKAPPNFEGYDLICIHPDPRCQQKKLLRIQVKSRYQTDNDRVILVKERTFDAFDFLVMVFENIGYFSSKGYKVLDEPELHKPEFYCFPNHWIRAHHKTGWGGKVPLVGLEKEIQKYRDEKGFNSIADALGVEYPDRP
jgi:hypothetical protein